jgi:putative ABC transport system permease protein
VSGATSVPTAPAWLIVFTPEGPPLSNSPVGYSTVVHPGFFETLGVPLRAGRVFTEQDRAGTNPVAVISESVARRFWPNENAVGKRLHQGSAENNMPWRTIVGVVADVKQGGLDESQPMSIYMPTLQLDTGLVTSITRGTSFVVRSDRDPAALVNPIRAIVRELDPTLPIGVIQPLETMLASTVASRRFNVLLLGTFAVIALALAAIGTYGLMAFAVVQRTREIGIRLAIGAAPRDVLRLVVRQGLALALAGVGLGLLGALLLTRVLRSLLFEVNPLDPTTFGAVALLLLGVSLMASILPAQRAARIDPNSAIRQE